MSVGVFMIEITGEEEREGTWVEDLGTGLVTRGRGFREGMIYQSSGRRGWGAARMGKGKMPGRAAVVNVFLLPEMNGLRDHGVCDNNSLLEIWGIALGR